MGLECCEVPRPVTMHQEVSGGASETPLATNRS
jgi:hypothetical protein